VQPSANLYFFARLSPAVKPEIAWLRDVPGLVQTPVTNDRLHMTMGALGGFDRGLIDRVVERLKGQMLPSFRMIADRIVATPERVFLQPSEGLLGFDTLQALLVVLLADILEEHGVDGRQWARRHRPHITLGYRSTWSVTRAIEPISWMVERLDLVESLRGRSIHIVHDSWTLKPRKTISASSRTPHAAPGP